MSYGGDRVCKYCPARIRWCRDVDRKEWLPLDLVPIPWQEDGAEWVVIGSQDARKFDEGHPPAPRRPAVQAPHL